jgi:4-hydroxy-3-methylbut-2-enyl diphosphate reductase IspH
MASATMSAPEKLLLAAPRGYCAGVDRAVQTVERALELYGAPVYVRKEIVHNKHVVSTLRDKGAVFVDELDDSVPAGAVTVFSAHGVSPAVHADRVAYVSQTTLSVDETRTIIARLRERFPNITGPRTDDICYATTNRQAAVKKMAGECDLVLVIGSRNSSNSNRLVDVARAAGARSHLIDNEAQVEEEWLDGARVVGISSGASAPEELVQRLVEFFRARGTQDISEFEVMREDVRFMLPKGIRQAMAAREG